MIEHKFRILGKRWVLRILTKKEYHKRNGYDSVAITKIHKRRIDMYPSSCDKETLIHELVHAYLVELCTHSADLTTDALEEIFAEMMAKRGQELLKLADRLLKAVRAVKNRL